MQFRLFTLFAIVTLAALPCGIIFGLPGEISIPFLTCALWVSPSVWIAGAAYARGWRRAFFIGAVAGGVVPFVFTVMGSALETDVSSFIMGRPRPRNEEIIECLKLLTPVAFSIVGGVFSVCVFLASRQDDEST